MILQNSIILHTQAMDMGSKGSEDLEGWIGAGKKRVKGDNGMGGIWNTFNNKKIFKKKTKKQKTHTILSWILLWEAKIFKYSLPL